MPKHDPVRVTLRSPIPCAVMGRWALFCLAAFYLAACAHTPPPPPATGPLFFPPPPEQARVQYLGSISSPKDLPAQRNPLADFILGPEPIRYPLAKPYIALLVGPKLFICDTVFNRVLVYNLETGESRTLLGDQGNGKIQQPNNIAVDGEGQLYVADKIRGAVLIYAADESFVTAWGRPEECKPVAVAVGAKYLYVCDVQDHQIELWDRKTGELVRTVGKKGTALGEFYYPTFLALTPEGHLLVTDTFNGRVQELTAEGEPVGQFGGLGNMMGQFAWPKGLGVDAHGRIYVADSRFANVQIFDAQHRLLLFFGGPGPARGNLDLPAGLSVLPWPDLPWLNERVASGFSPESLVIVVSQKGAGFINFFAVARSNEPTAQ